MFLSLFKGRFRLVSFVLVLFSQLQLMPSLSQAASLDSDFFRLAINHASVEKSGVEGNSDITLEDAARGYLLGLEARPWAGSIGVGQFSFTPMLRAVLTETSYARADESYFDIRRVSASAGVRSLFFKQSRFPLELAPQLSFEQLKQGTGSQNGYGLRLHARSPLTERLNMHARLAYLDLSLQNGYEFAVGANWQWFERVSVFTEVELNKLSAPDDVASDTDEGDFSETALRLGLQIDLAVKRSQ